ncbi:MAG: glycine zipper 2TM domain-containing protein [Burkholderiales bacterium]
MEPQTGKSLHPLVWVAGVVFIVFCGAGVAALMGWMPGSAGKQAEPSPAVRLDHPRASAAERPRPAAKVPVAAICAECGVIQSVHEVDTNGPGGSGIGAVGGAVVGGVLGHQVGQGDGKKVATVVGAVGGALAGNEIEKRVNVAKTFEITVRLDDGSSRVITEANATSWRVGDKVRVVNGVIHAG